MNEAEAPGTPREQRWVVAIVLLVSSTCALAWLPAFAKASAATLHPWLATVAGASFLALAHRSWRATDEPGTDRRRAARAIWIVALLLRLPAFFAPAWPFDAPSMSGLVDPPVAQFLAKLGARGDFGWKLLVLAADLGVVGLLLRGLAQRELPAARALLYAWHPLVVLEFAGSGRVDAVALLLLLAAVAGRAPELAQGACAGLAGMVKPQGFVAIVGFVVQKRFVALAAAVATALLLWLPLRNDGARMLDGLARYAFDSEFNGFVTPVMTRIAGGHGRTLSLLVLALVAWWLARRFRERPVELALGLLAALVATAPAVHPWHVAWLVPFLPFVSPRGGRALLLLTVTTLAALAVQAQYLATGTWSEPAWVALLTWLPPSLLGALDLWRGTSGGELRA